MHKYIVEILGYTFSLSDVIAISAITAENFHYIFKVYFRDRADPILFQTPRIATAARANRYNIKEDYIKAGITPKDDFFQYTDKEIETCDKFHAKFFFDSYSNLIEQFKQLHATEE